MLNRINLIGELKNLIQLLKNDIHLLSVEKQNEFNEIERKSNLFKEDDHTFQYDKHAQEELNKLIAHLKGMQAEISPLLHDAAIRKINAIIATQEDPRRLRDKLDGVDASVFGKKHAIDEYQTPLWTRFVMCFFPCCNDDSDENETRPLLDQQRSSLNK